MARSTPLSMSDFLCLGALACVVAAPMPVARAQDSVAPTVRVTIPPLTRGEPFTGWMTMYLLGDDASLPLAFVPSDGPFLDDPQPIYSMYVDDAQAGDVIEFKPTRGFPGPFPEIPAGRYRAQIVLDRGQEHTSWVHEFGNLYSPIRRFEVTDESSFVQFPMLNNSFWPIPSIPDVEVIEIASPTMEGFGAENPDFKIGVVYPENYDPDREYAAVYLMPGFALAREFGGDEREAFNIGAERIRPNQDHHSIWADAFLFTISPQAQWGHSMFTDSPANGPVETALLGDIIPALEERFPLVAAPEGRLLLGHGAGGWAAIWLQMNHPETFGGAWAASPDPVDFRAFLNTDIYSDADFFVNDRGQPRGFYRTDGVVRCTNEEAAAMEEVMGPGLTSAKQLAGWQAAFGPVGDDGRTPARLFDPMTGRIDREVAQAWRERDISDRLRANPERYGPVFRDAIRIVVGESDNFTFHRAVRMLADELRELGYTGRSGYVEVQDGVDFGATEEISRSRMLDEMRETLGANNLLRGN